MARLDAAQLSNLTVAWQIRGNFAAKPWQPAFRKNRAPPHHCREKTLSCRKKKTRLGLARGSPQRNHMRLMLRAAWFGRLSLSPSRAFGFRGVRAAIRLRGARASLISASIDAGICVPHNHFTTPRRVSRCAVALFRVIRRAITRENTRACHRPAATCLKFAARLGAAHGTPTVTRGKPFN
jgi:hypothetical protein